MEILPAFYMLSKIKKEQPSFICIRTRLDRITYFFLQKYLLCLCPCPHTQILSYEHTHLARIAFGMRELNLFTLIKLYAPLRLDFLFFSTFTTFSFILLLFNTTAQITLCVNAHVLNASRKNKRLQNGAWLKAKKGENVKKLGFNIGCDLRSLRNVIVAVFHLSDCRLTSSGIYVWQFIRDNGNGCALKFLPCKKLFGILLL